jgi:hypothetical protein
MIPGAISALPKQLMTKSRHSHVHRLDRTGGSEKIDKDVFATEMYSMVFCKTLRESATLSIAG